MGYDHVIALSKFLVWGILGSAAFILFLKATTGRINLSGLLSANADGPGFSASRIQLLFMTLIGAFGYLGLVIDKVGTPCAPTGCALPDPPSEVLLLFGGSQAFYLGAKGIITGNWLAGLRGNGGSP
jgi:hypothetical protein